MSSQGFKAKEGVRGSTSSIRAAKPARPTVIGAASPKAAGETLAGGAFSSVSTPLHSECHDQEVAQGSWMQQAQGVCSKASAACQHGCNATEGWASCALSEVSDLSVSN